MKAEQYDPTKDQIGCIYGVPNEAYHKHKAISNTQLFEYHKRPALFEAKLRGEVEETQSEALSTGSGAHSAALEGREAFQEQFTILPIDLDWRSKDGKTIAVDILSQRLEVPVEDPDAIVKLKKEEILDFFNQRTPKTILTHAQYEDIKRILDSLDKHEKARDLLSGGVAEVTFRTAELESGFQLQCRFDKLNVEGCNTTDGQPYGLDLKTIRSLDEWQKAFERRGYYRGYPFYHKVQEIAMGGSIIKYWFWIVVEKEPPYRVRVFAPSPEVYLRGMAEIKMDLESLAEAFKTGSFPEPGKDEILIQTLSDYMIDREPQEPGSTYLDVWTPRRDYESEFGWEKETKYETENPGSLG